MTTRNVTQSRGITGIFFPVEFHISRKARERYGFDLSLYGFDGNVVIADLDAIHHFAQRLNELRLSAVPPEPPVRAGQINALGLIDEVLHFMSARYRELVNPPSLAAAVERIDRALGPEIVDRALLGFVEEFPGIEVYRGAPSPSAYLRSDTGGVPNRQIAMEELLLLALGNQNPAFAFASELFDDSGLKAKTAYEELIRKLEEFYRTQPVFGPERLPLVRLLAAPARAAPDSLAGQLRYMRDRWAAYLPPDLLNRLLIGLDLLREEERLRGQGPGPAVVPNARSLGYLDADAFGRLVEYEKYSPDLDWMPRVVLLAKNTYVWLDQLSKRYGRPIKRLDQIPDEEIDRLGRWGFTGLWLIGMWERSPASRKIKQGYGNPEAGASAYSLYDYEIAAELGGEGALVNLKERAMRRGLRLTSDMVPNHMGIYSRWVIERPDYFIQARTPPFPGYRFTGGDLSSDPRVGICIEDGYWSRRDAAVVFQRVDRQTGDVRYIYHGNDGTSMPWNDTAQLDFLKAEVREAVIQNILNVARRFSVIRFDAAMVLTRMHFQRLWYPPPGSGGAIPSRAGRGLPPEEFDRLMPKEFWREVVDRVAAEVPDTLLLAEAFWLLEGYFVRTLGMHRVYNSAFMNMLKMELNSEYRQLVKNVIEFDPQILKRFVNFMSNPDEATAVAQFGKGDKYFGVCTMMVTMPGLPLFGHGQIEGLTEKYGMEYRKAYWDEPLDEFLVRRHEEEIFPLMKRRPLFSDVTHFYLYDFYLKNGRVNEDVFAYSNRYQNERALVVFHNRYDSTAGWIRLSAARTVKSGGKKKLERVDLVTGLGLRADPDGFCVYRDLRSGLEYIRSSRSLRQKGLYLEVGAYQTYVFTAFREIKDDRDGLLAQLEHYLGGRGVRNINEAIRKIHFRSLHGAWRALVDVEMVRRAFQFPAACHTLSELDRGLTEMLSAALKIFWREAARAGKQTLPVEEGVGSTLRGIKAAALLSPAPDLPPWTATADGRTALKHLRGAVAPLEPRLEFFRLLFLYAVLDNLGRALGEEAEGFDGSAPLKEWFLGEMVVQFLQTLGVSWDDSLRELSLLALLLRHGRRFREIKSKRRLDALLPLFEDNEVRQYLRFNWHEEILWFHRESFETLMRWFGVAAVFDQAVRGWKDGKRKSPRVKRAMPIPMIRELLRLARKAEYRFKDFQESLVKTEKSKVKSQK